MKLSRRIVSRRLLVLAGLGLVPFGCSLLDLGSDDNKQPITTVETDGGTDTNLAPDAQQSSADVKVSVDTSAPTGGTCAVMPVPGVFCVQPDPRKPQQEPVTITGAVTSLATGGSCDKIASAQDQKVLAIKSAGGETTQVTIVLPGLDLPVKVGDTVTVAFHGGAPPTMAFSSYYPAISIEKAGKLIAFSGRPSSFFPGGNPGGITFTSGALICTADHSCGPIDYNQLDASAGSATLSLSTGQSGTLATYRIVNNLVASSRKPKCADWAVSEMLVGMVAQ